MVRDLLAGSCCSHKCVSDKMVFALQHMEEEFSPITSTEPTQPGSEDQSVSQTQDEIPAATQSQNIETTQQAKGPSSNTWNTLREAVETILLAVILFVGINMVTARVRVDGFSMLPTLHDGDMILVNRLAYRLAEPKRGEIIVFHFPGDPSQEYIKRIIGLPGDSIFVQGGEVLVNGQTLSEPYIADAPDYAIHIEVPADSLFVLGDNRNNSSDSHTWGELQFQYVVGKAVLIYWPIDAWGWAPHAQAMP